MKNESVAILDIRSREISFSLGAKGVNGTFAFSGSKTEGYEGFVTNGFLDESSFRRAVVSAITSVRQNYEGTISEVYVGVPSAFIKLYTKGHTISFPSKRKISEQDVDALFDSGMNDLLANGRCVRRSAMYFALGDNRKYFSAKDLYGVSTNMLKGALCYYFVSEEFYQTVSALLSNLHFVSVKFIPSTLAQSEYLFAEKKREGYAFLLDVGFLTSSISVVYGNGIVHEENFDFGEGTVLVDLMESLGVDFSTAQDILSDANISGGAVDKDMIWYSEKDNRQIPVRIINDVIKCSLDELCERIEVFFITRYKEKPLMNLASQPISLTGEGVYQMKGMAEHIAKRLNRLTETVYPDLPYYDKPSFSSQISLLNAATGEVKKNTWFQKIFNGFGGKKK